MKKLLSLIICLFLISAFAVTAYAFPVFDGFVSDPAGALSDDVRGEIETLSESLRQKNGCSVYVCCTDSLDGMSIRDYSRALIKTLDGGDTSVLFVMFPEGGDYYACAGGGLSETVSYDDLKSMLSSSAEGAFSAENYGAAAVSFAQSAASKLAENERADEENNGSPLGHTFFVILIIVIVIAGVFILILFIMRSVNVRRARRRRAGRRRPLR